MESVPTPEGSIEVQILTSVDFERMTEKLRALDKPYRGILQLKYFAELSNTKIGEYLGLTNRQVETRLYRAKQRLRKAFFDNYPDDDDDNKGVARNG